MSKEAYTIVTRGLWAESIHTTAWRYLQIHVEHSSTEALRLTTGGTLICCTAHYCSVICVLQTAVQREHTVYKNERRRWAGPYKGMHFDLLHCTLHTRLLRSTTRQKYKEAPPYKWRCSNGRKSDVSRALSASSTPCAGMNISTSAWSATLLAADPTVLCLVCGVCVCVCVCARVCLYFSPTHILCARALVCP